MPSWDAQDWGERCGFTAFSDRTGWNSSATRSFRTRKSELKLQAQNLCFPTLKLTCANLFAVNPIGQNWSARPLITWSLVRSRPGQPLEPHPLSSCWFFLTSRILYAFTAPPTLGPEHRAHGHYKNCAGQSDSTSDSSPSGRHRGRKIGTVTTILIHRHAPDFRVAPLPLRPR